MNLRFFLKLFIIWVLSSPISAVSASTKAPLPDLPLWMPALKEIKQRGKLIVATTSGHNPLCRMLTPDGKLVGIDIDIMQDLADKLGVKLQMLDHFKGNEDVVNYVAQNKADFGIAKMSYSIERSRKVFYSKPYLVVKQAMLINRRFLTKTSKNMTVVDFLNNERSIIAVVKQSAYYVYAKSLFPKAQIIQGDWDKEIIPKIMKGEITAAFRDEIRVKNHLKTHPVASLTLYPLIFKAQLDPIMVVSRPNSQSLLEWLNAYLNFQLDSSTSVNSLMQKYKEYLK